MSKPDITGRSVKNVDRRFLLGRSVDAIARGAPWICAVVLRDVAAKFTPVRRGIASGVSLDDAPVIVNTVPELLDKEVRGQRRE